MEPMLSKLFFGVFKQQDTKNFMRLMTYIKRYKVRIFIALLATAGVAFTESYLAAFIAPLINQGFSAAQLNPPQINGTGFIDKVSHMRALMTYWIWGSASKVWMVPLFLVGLVMFRGFCRYFSSYLLSWVGAVVLKELRAVMFQKMLLLPSKYQLTHPSAFTSNRFLLDANNAISNAINVFITR